MKILIASTLKPVNDTRLYEKIALTLVSKGNHEVSIAGYSASTSESSAKKVKFYPLFKFERLSLQRLFAPLVIIRLTLRLKPDILLIATHELLVAAFFLKIVSNQKVVYDIQENYAYNIRYMQTFPPIVRQIVAFFVRCKEILIAPLIDGFILAENVYQRQLTFIKDRYIVLPNKIRLVENEILSLGLVNVSKPLHFLYTGSISKEYGIWQAIAFIDKLEKIDKDVNLKILGYTASKALHHQLKDELKDKKYIVADIRLAPVPYSEISAAQKQGAILLLPYRPSKAIEGKIPTRLFEGMARRLPMVIEGKLNLQFLTGPYNAAVYIDFAKFNAIELLNTIKSQVFYTANPEREVLWSFEEEKLLQWINKLDNA